MQCLSCFTLITFRGNSTKEVVSNIMTKRNAGNYLKWWRFKVFKDNATTSGKYFNVDCSDLKWSTSPDEHEEMEDRAWSVQQQQLSCQAVNDEPALICCGFFYPCSWYVRKPGCCYKVHTAAKSWHFAMSVSLFCAETLSAVIFVVCVKYENVLWDGC